MEHIFISDKEYGQLVAHTEALVAAVDNLPYPNVKDDVHQLLQNFDLLHREALTRLFKEIIIHYPDLHTKMESDKAVHLLFSLYDLFKADLPGGWPGGEERLNGSGKYPLWLPVGNIHRMKEDTLYKFSEEGENILLCKTGGTVYAVKNCCSNTALPLDGGTIDQGYLICPWHGCAYRLSDGAMERHPEQQLTLYPLDISDEGEIRVGLNM